MVVARLSIGLLWRRRADRCSGLSKGLLWRRPERAGWEELAPAGISLKRLYLNIILQD